MVSARSLRHYGYLTMTKYFVLLMAVLTVVFILMATFKDRLMK